MPAINPLAVLAGLGAGATSLGQSIDTRKVLDDQQRRRDANDAFSRLMAQIGAGITPEGAQFDPPTNAPVSLPGMHVAADRASGYGEVNGPASDPVLMPKAPAAGPFGQAYTVDLPSADGTGRTKLRVDPNSTSQARAALFASENRPPAYHAPVSVGEGDTLVDPATGKPLFSAPKKTLTPQSPHEVTSVGKDGKRHIMRAMPDGTYSDTGMIAPEPSTTVGLKTVQNPDGSKSYVSAADAAGKTAAIAPTPKAGAGLVAPMALRVGQYGEMLKKAPDLFSALESLDVDLGQSAGQDIAQHGLGAGPVRIPGTKGIGSLMVNRTPQYSRYQASLTPFVLAAGHAIGGARVSDTQLQKIRESIERVPGDSPEVKAQKDKNLMDLINSIGGSLPADAVGEQEGQMDAATLELLHGRGYKGPSTKAAPNAVPPSGRGPGAGPAQDDHSGVSDDDFARAWRAGVRDNFAAWVKAHPKGG